jgi:hypothetical protein
MSNFLSTEKFKLEVRWEKVLRPKSGEMHLVDAYFTGPVLAQAEKINSNDYITIDFCSQFVVLVKNVFIAKFSWGEVTYGKDNKVYLKNAMLTYDPLIQGIPNLENADYLVIDTRDHENEKHLYNMLYPAYTIDNENELYDYRR